MKIAIWLGSLISVVGRSLLVLLTLGLLVWDLGAAHRALRGVEDGLDPQLPALNGPRLGTNVALEQYTTEVELERALAKVRSLGLGIVRQRLAWADLEPERGQYHWEVWDRVLPRVAQQGLEVIVVLDTSPAWARPAWEADNPSAPPQDAAEFARFAAAVAGRYGGIVRAYQVWDRPNIYPHWGQGAIAPGEYVTLLAQASQAIRAADADALIIAGGLAPNLESGGRNMSDVQFLREIYRRGADAYFDILGVHAYGFWTGPYDRRTTEGVLNLSRVVLLREEMVRRGEAFKPMWALEGGWGSLPAGWAGDLPSAGDDSALVQGQRLEQAIERMRREWPWMTCFCPLALQPLAEANDPIWGYALVGHDGQRTSLYGQLQWLATMAPVAYPGRSPELAPYLAGHESGVTELRVWGDTVAIELLPGEAVSLTIHSDLEPRLRAVTRVAGVGESQRLVWRSADAPGAHRLMIEGDAAQVRALGALTVGAQRRNLRAWVMIAVGLGGAACLAAMAYHAGKYIPWRAAWGWWRRRWEGLPAPARWLAMLLPLSALLWGPSPMVRLGALGVYGLVALCQPEFALLGAIATIPLAPLSVALGPLSFSITELTVLTAFAARMGQAVLAPEPQVGRRPRLHWLDGVVLAFACLGVVAALRAEYQHVALRELRVTILEPALLYALIRRQRAPALALRAVDVLWLASVGVALYALARYPSASGVIQAEGVRRAKAFFGSPNNLALWLERALPVGLALAVWGQTRWRRWLYGLGAAPIATALVLTFSRGAWLLGLPALLAALGWARGRRWRWGVLTALGLGVVGLLLFARVPRLAALLDWSQGTGFLRVRLWQAAWAMVRAHPWLGVGPDNFLYYYGDYLLPGAEVDRWLSHPHNLALDFWLRLGVGGVLLLGAMLVGFWRRVWGALAHARPDTPTAVVIGLAAGMAAGLAHGLVDSFYFVPELAYWFLFSLAWVSAWAPRSSER